MAEVKRPKLNSFGCERANKKNTKEIPETVRVSVLLTESTEDSFPEFNYQDELLAVKRKSIKNPIAQTNGLDPCNDEDEEEVKRIAAQMEAKYGGVPKKRKYRKDDFADIGMGYDESDSFIDNTDGYDEMVPKNTHTVLGGFYINSGALVFKTDEVLSSNESISSDDETRKNVHNRKRILGSSAASEEEAPDTEKSELPEKKQKLIVNGMQKAIKKRLFGHDKIKQIRKKRNSESKRTVRDLLKDIKVDTDTTISNFIDSAEIKDTISIPNENKKSPDSVDNVIESVINAVVAKKKEDKFEDIIKDATRENGSKDYLVNNPSVHSSFEGDSNDVGFTAKSPLEYVQLPENLPSDIVEIIDSMKSAAASSTEGKVKFFTGNVNLLLLNLERKCKCLGRRSRNKVYEHLAPFVKCRKETLIKRAKNLVVIEEKKKIKTLLDKLKAVVGMTMPTILKNYEEESMLIVQKKFSSDEEANKSLRMPKRHFPWTEETKKLVRDITTLQKKCLLNEGKHKDSLEQNLITFLKSEVQIIWPEGWMSMNTLMKYSNITKDKKILDVSKRNSINTSIDIKDSLLSSTNISINSNSSLTITPVSSVANRNSFGDVKTTTIIPDETIISGDVKTISIIPNEIITSGDVKTISIIPNEIITSTDVKTTSVIPSETIISSDIEPMPIPPTDTIITRINVDDNTSISSISLPLTPPDIIKILQPEHSNIDHSGTSTNLLSNNEESQIQNLVLKDKQFEEKAEDILTNEIKVENEECTHDTKALMKENINRKADTTHTADVKQKSGLDISVIDLTDQPELIRKPGPKSKTKYFPSDYSNDTKIRKESSKLNEEYSGTSALNMMITDSLNLDLSKVTHRRGHHTSSSSLSHSNSVLKNHTYDYSKSSDYSKPKLSVKDLSKINLQSNDSSRIISPTYDMSKVKSPTITNDLPKTKSPTIVNDLSKIKSPINDLYKSDLPNDYNQAKSVSEGDDFQKAMEGLMVLQKMSSPVKPKDESRSSAAVPVINYNKGYTLNSRHGLPSAASSTINNDPRRSSSFQDAFQKQFIPGFNLMKASQTSPSKGNYNSIPKYNHTSHKSNSSSSDRYLQNSNSMYPQQSSSNKYKSVNCSSSQSGNSKSSTHQK